ncbi:MAG: glycosyltransferase family 9 protein [Armatimonadetes bacterium]|nr:glycosyltransferase family 9 protein [Armatimonadota bacterium]
MNRAERWIVVIRPDDKLGETLLATPVFQAIKETLPEFKVAAWVGHRWRSVIEASPWLDAVRGVPYRPRLSAYWRLASTLRRQRPEAVLILRPDTRRYAQIARLAGVKARVGAVVRRPRVARLLTHVAALNPCAHQVEKNLAVAETWLGRPLPRYPLHYAPATRGNLPDTLASHPRYAVLHLSTGGVQPRWAVERFAAVGEYLLQRYAYTPVFTGSADDAPAESDPAALFGQAAVNLVGQTSILDMAEILRRAALLVSVDTGVVHLAAAVGTPCISLHFRRDYPPENWYAWQTPTVPVSPPYYCEGCTQHACILKDLACVRGVSVEQVIAAVDTLLAQGERISRC